MNISIGVWEHDFLRNIWFLVHLFNQITMQTILEISAHFWNDGKCHDSETLY